MSAERRKRKRRKNLVLQRVEYAVFRAVLAVTRLLSEESIIRWGERLGILGGKVLRRRDRLAMANLRAAFPEKSEAELRTILDACWRHFGRETLVYVHMQTLSLEEITRRCDFAAMHHLDEAFARGKGLLLISAHYGGWEMAGLAMMSMLPNLRMVARPLDNEYLDRDLARLRQRTGAQVMDRRGAARPLLRGLNENAAIVLLPDQAVQPQEGILVPFIGRPAWTTPVPAKLAARAGSTIVFGFCIPDGTRYRIELEQPIRMDELSEEERDPSALTARINDVISRRIRERPELWLWMHDRWKGTGKK